MKQTDAAGTRKLRLAVDFVGSMNTLTPEPTVPNIGDSLQAVVNFRLISIFDANSGYHQTLVKESDCWLTSFVCEIGQIQCVRTPCGMRNSGTTFVRAIQIALQKTRSFTKSYVDDMAVHLDIWSQQLDDIETQET